MMCRSAVLAAPGQELSIETIEIGPLGPNDVLVRIGAASLCHTDLEVIQGELAFPMPIVLGHEASGVIADVGENISRGRIGERVVLSWNPHCGQCFQCRRDQPILCDEYLREGPRGRQRDGETRLSLDGRALATMFFTAAFAEYAVVEATCAVRVPDAMPFDRACLIGCAVMTGVGAALRIAQVEPDEVVMVIGCGAVGISAIQGARLAAASTIIAVDPLAGKRALALELGATHAIEPERALELARSLTMGRGADVVIESAGAPAALRLSAEACRPGGRIVWLGKLPVNEDVTFRWGSLMGEKRIIRSSYGGARPARDFPMLAEAYLEGRLDLDALVTQRLSLAEINQGFQALRSGGTIRSVIVFD